MPSEAALQMLSNARSYFIDGAGSSHDGCAYQQTGGDTLCIETRSDVKRLDSLMQNDTRNLVGTSNPIWFTRVKDGDIRLRWTFLVPVCCAVCWSNFSDVATAHFLVSRRAFERTLYNMMPRDTWRRAVALSRAYDLCLAEV
jgi:hypothetical protein